MSSKARHAVIISFLGKTKDRFHEYNRDLDLAGKMSMAAEIDGMRGVEVVYPYEVNDPVAFKSLLRQNGLSAAAINANVKAEPEFRNGGLTSIDKTVRAKAVDLIKKAKDFALAVGADKVTCCPLGDGYEFNFDCDYAQMWRYLADGFGEAGSYLPEIPLYIEYKPSETRARCFVDTASKTLCLLNDIGVRGMGVTLDFGHSMYANENPAEALSLVAQTDYPFYIHINDNDARWDWDLMAGSRHLLDYMEFIYYLQEYKYTGFLTSDTSPVRWDIRETFAVNARVTNKIWMRLEQIDRSAFRRLISERDYMRTWKFVENEIIRL